MIPSGDMVVMLSSLHLSALAVASVWCPTHPGLAIPTVIANVARHQFDTLMTSTDWPSLHKPVAGWCVLTDRQKSRILIKLAESLNSNSKVPLVGVQPVLIPYRMKTGELKFAGHGRIVQQDLFFVGGRAAWAIFVLLKDEGLPVLDGGLSAGGWDKRALAIAAKVKAFVEKAAKCEPKNK